MSSGGRREGSGRKSAPLKNGAETKDVRMTLDADVYERLRAYCKNEGLMISRSANRLLREILPELNE